MLSSIIRLPSLPVRRGAQVNAGLDIIRDTPAPAQVVVASQPRDDAGALAPTRIEAVVIEPDAEPLRSACDASQRVTIHVRHLPYPRPPRCMRSAALHTGHGPGPYRPVPWQYPHVSAHRQNEPSRSAHS